MAPQPEAQTKKKAEEHPQAIISKFWKGFQTKVPGKITAIFPRKLRAGLAPHLDAQLVQRRNAEQSYEEARTQCMAMVRVAVDQCERTNSKFTDPEFDLVDDHYLGDDHCLYMLDGQDSDSEDEDATGVSTSQLQYAVEKMVKSRIMPNENVVVNLRTLGNALEEGDSGGSGSRPKAVHRVDWIFETPQFTVDGYSSSDIVQGAGGDCWWLAAIASIAHRRDLMDRICVARDEECGVYGFVFYRDGEWFPVVIDDNLYVTNKDYEAYSTTDYDVTGKKARKYRKQHQTNSEALHFAKCEEENETWLPLMEKAFAKAHGDYGSIHGGWAGAGVEDLTGGVTTTLHGPSILRKDRLWRELLVSDKEGGEFVFSLSSAAESGVTHKHGITTNHAYSILKAAEIEDEKGRKVRLVKIKNPWGRRAYTRSGDWEGPWSNGSPEWTAHTMRLLGHKFADDGSSWMTLEDMLQSFKTIHRCRLFDERWTVVQKWTSESISWLAGYLQTKFVIEVKREGLVVLVLAQLDERYFKSLQGQYVFYLSFKLRKAGSATVLSEARGPSLDRRSVNCEINLQPGTYEVLPKVVAEHRPYRCTVEHQVKKYAKKAPVKLRQVGLQHDLAHAKVGVLDEDAANEERNEKRRRKKQKEKKRASNDAEMEASVNKLKAALAEMEAQLKSYQEKEKDGKAHPDESAKDKAASDQPVADKVSSNSEEKTGKETEQVPGVSPKSPPGAWPGAPMAQAESEGAKESRNEKKKDDKEQHNNIENPGDNMVSTDSTGEQKTENEPEPPAPLAEQAPQEAPQEIRQEEAKVDTVERKATPESSSANTPDASDSESDSETEEGTEKEPKWNPVCVMGLRVYTEDKEVQVRVEKQEGKTTLDKNTVTKKEKSREKQTIG